MKNIILYMTFISLIAPVRADGLQLFGSKSPQKRIEVTRAKNLEIMTK